MKHEEDDKYLDIDNTYEEYVAYRGNETCECGSNMEVNGEFLECIVCGYSELMEVEDDSLYNQRF